MKRMLVTMTLLVPAGAPLRAEETCVYEYEPAEFATTVVEYIEGEGVPTDALTGLPFNDPSAALGRPTADTTGDAWDIPAEAIVPVVPVYPAFRSFELVSTGVGGRLTVRFDHPVTNDSRNPYGVDFIIFGNANYILDWQTPWTNGDPNLTTVLDPGGFVEPGTVSVSQDGAVWHTFSGDMGPHADPEGPYVGTDGPYADVFAPTLGRVYDPGAPDEALGAWNLWWSLPTDPTLPVDPRLKWVDFQFLTVAEIATAYEDSAGGTAFDLDWLEVPGLDWIQYVRIEGLETGGAPEIDAISDVFSHLGDFERDGDVDLADFARFQNCFTGSGNERALRACFSADFDGNLVAAELDVDLDDFARFRAHWLGPREIE